MPFTLGGDYVPPKKEPSSKGPVKVRSVRRKNSFITEILNLNLEDKEIRTLAKSIKQKLGCGGSVKGTTIEIQGKKEQEIRKILSEQGIQSK